MVNTHGQFYHGPKWGPLLITFIRYTVSRFYGQFWLGKTVDHLTDIQCILKESRCYKQNAEEHPNIHCCQVFGLNCFAALPTKGRDGVKRSFTTGPGLPALVAHHWTDIDQHEQWPARPTFQHNVNGNNKSNERQECKAFRQSEKNI